MHHATRDAILRDHADGFNLKTIAACRCVTVEEVQQVIRGEWLPKPPEPKPPEPKLTEEDECELRIVAADLKRQGFDDEVIKANFG